MEAEGITYTLVGDYLLPDLILPCQDGRPIGIYGQRHGESTSKPIIKSITIRILLPAH